MKVTLALVLLVALGAAACRATSEDGQADGDVDAGSSDAAGVQADALFEGVYRGLATLRLLVEDGPDQAAQRDDSERYVGECAEMPGGCNLEAFRLFYANTPEGAARAYEETRRACVAALAPEGSAGPQREALTDVCGGLPELVRSSGLFEVDVAALDAAIARLAAVAN